MCEPELLKAINEVSTGTFVCKPHRIESGSKELKRAINQLTGKIENRFPGLINARWVSLRLLEGDVRMIEAVRTGELGELIKPVEVETILAVGAA